jgi:REP element-mobilizing transposase RayT
LTTSFRAVLFPFVRENTKRKQDSAKRRNNAGERLMVAGYHLIWTAYGWWLPNDPRGSSSCEIRVERIADLGELHRGRKAVQPPGWEIRRFYGGAGEALKHELLTFTDDQILLLASAFAAVIRECRYTCYECAIMPDHVHALIRRHRDSAEVMIENLQVRGNLVLVDMGYRPPTHPVWGGKGWKVFLNTRADMERVVKYIHNNPIKAGRPEQRWAFVTKYDGWLPSVYGCAAHTTGGDKEIT